MRLLTRGGRSANTNPNSLTAAGERIKERTAEDLRRLSQPWQFRSLDYYNMSGPAWYAAQFYARMLAPLRLFAAEKTDEGEIVPTENEVAQEQLERIQDPGGGRSGLQAAYGRLYFLNGEARLLCSNNPDTELEQWEMLSVRELKLDGDRIYRCRAPSVNPVEYRQISDDDYSELTDNKAVAYRLWRRHPEFSDEADAPMRGVLDDLEELLLLTRAVRSRARSRLAGSGMLFIDERISKKPPEPQPGEALMVDRYYKNMADAMMAPLANEGAPSEIIPILSRVPVPEGMSLRDMVYHLQIIDPVQLYPETGLRMECLKRIAIGLDMPSEVLTGLADVNHWTGWLVDESTWKGHGEPVAQQLCNDLTDAFYRPTLKAEKLPNWDKYVIAFDAAAVVNHPDRSKDAKDLYDRRAIGKAALRDAADFGEEDAPDEAELNEMIGVAVRDGSLAIYGIPTVRSGGIEPEPGEIQAGDSSIGPAETAKEPPPAPAGGSPQDAPNGEVASAMFASRVIGASEFALLRCRQAAGNRIRSHAKRDPEVLKLLEDVATGDVAAVLGREAVKELKTPDELMLVRAARELIEDALRVWGINDAEVAALIADRIEQHAARTLYEQRPIALPPSLMNYIAGVASSLPLGAV